MTSKYTSQNPYFSVRAEPPIGYRITEEYGAVAGVGLDKSLETANRHAKGNLRKSAERFNANAVLGIVPAISIHTDHTDTEHASVLLTGDAVRIAPIYQVP